MDYLKDPAKIYAQSFETVRREARIGGMSEAMATLVVRVVHACGMPDIVDDLSFSDGAAESGRRALRAGTAIFADCEMVKSGIISSRLPSGNRVICTLNDDTVPDAAHTRHTTRSAAAVDLWSADLAGAVVAVGNAPTALFRLLERLDEGAPKPALILGFPVGFVGAAESKEELSANSRGVAFITLKGHRGGSAMASAAVNALCGDKAQ